MLSCKIRKYEELVKNSRKTSTKNTSKKPPANFQRNPLPKPPSKHVGKSEKQSKINGIRNYFTKLTSKVEQDIQQIKKLVELPTAKKTINC